MRGSSKPRSNKQLSREVRRRERRAAPVSVSDPAVG